MPKKKLPLNKATNSKVKRATKKVVKTVLTDKAKAKKEVTKKKAPKKTTKKSNPSPSALSKVKMTAADRKQHERWEAEEDLRTLSRAEEIKTDKGRMGRVSNLAKEQIKTAQRFTGDDK